MKVLHVNFALERGGIETWIERLTRQFEPREYKFALAYHRAGSSGMAADLRDAGMDLLKLPSPRSPLRYMRAYRQLLRSAGPFDVVHSHVNFAGLLMLGARLEGIPARLAQSHVSPPLMTRGPIAGTYARLTNKLFLSNMTCGIGVSPNAAITLFSKRWNRNPKVTIEPCGIDLAPFDRAAGQGLRQELGLPEGSPVLGMIGRLSAEKNQAFSLRVAALLAKETESLRVLLVGAGKLREDLLQLARELQIQDKVILLGERRDVDEILRQAIDVLLMPSLTEGSPLTILEAQAAGVPCIASSVIPDHSVLAQDNLQKLPLEQGEQAWAKAVQRMLKRRANAPGTDRLRNSPFDIRHNAELLEAYYRGNSPESIGT